MRRRGASAFGALLTAASGILLFSLSELRPQSATHPMVYFRRMLPAIRHPRCNNCHGFVDPVTGRNHKEGPIHPDTACNKCHVETSEWRIPGEEHFFEGRTDQAICSQFSDFASFIGLSKFNQHASEDELIKLAFEGEKAGAMAAGAAPDKPPIDHAEFVQAAIDWTTRGNAACEPEGTIHIEESVTSSEHVTRGSANIWITQTGTRTVIVTSVGGGHRADIEVDGQIIVRSVHNLTNAAGQPCTITVTSRTQYAGSTTGPALVTIKDTLFRDPALHPPNSDHRIDIILPEEKTRTTVVHSVANLCGVAFPPLDDDVQEFEWPEWTYTLEGYNDRRGSRVARGGCNKTLPSDQAGQTLNIVHCNRFGHMGNATEPWLVNHGAASRYQNGGAIEFQIVTTWNLRRR
jgi:hypothetical protein